MRPIALLLFALLLTSCEKEPVIDSRVQLRASCGACVLQVKVNGGLVHDDTLGTSAQVGRYLYSEILSEGDEVELVARPINIGNIGTAIDCTVDGFVQAFEHTRPTDSTAMRTVRIALTVPELDRYGEVQ